MTTTSRELFGAARSLDVADREKPALPLSAREPIGSLVEGRRAREPSPVILRGSRLRLGLRSHHL